MTKYMQESDLEENYKKSIKFETNNDLFDKKINNVHFGGGANSL